VNNSLGAAEFALRLSGDSFAWGAIMFVNAEVIAERV